MQPQKEITDISGESYRNLESIFYWETDVAFLSTQPGYSAEIGHRHCAAKRKLAYQWLNELQTDFSYLYRHELLLLSKLDGSHSIIRRNLHRLKVQFVKRTILVRIRLLVNCPVIEDLRRLTTALEDLIGYRYIIEEM